MLNDNFVVAVGTYGTTLVREDGVWNTVVEPDWDNPRLFALWGYPSRGVLGIGRTSGIQLFDGKEWHNVYRDYSGEIQWGITGNSLGEVVVMQHNADLLFTNLGWSPLRDFDMNWVSIEIPDPHWSRDVLLTNDRKLFLVSDYTKVYEGSLQ